MAPTANSPGIPTLSGIEQPPEPAWKDEGGSMRVVLGFGSDSNDRIIGTVKDPRARANDSVAAVLGRLAMANGGQIEVHDPVYSNADQRGPAACPIVVNVSRVAWCARWVDFQAAYGMRDEASRS
jgi:hypothetical protein